MNKEKLVRTFTQLFQPNEPIQTFFAPGRINLIGEHTDYNGGHVFPAAISFGTYALATKRTDRLIKLYSMNFEETGIITVELDNLAYNKADQWANYPKGIVDYFIKTGMELDYGFNVLFYGDIPNGAGLSSSASIELATGVMLESLYQLDLDRIELVKLAQKVENQYIGVNCGIMDQFAIGMGKKDHGILLDCDTLTYQYAPINLKDNTILIMNTNKRRELADSKYNERRSECERALAALQTKLPINSLGELSIDQFEQHQALIENETERKRAKHAVYENQRTIDALMKLKNDDIIGFGKLLTASHRSLQYDYEVTGIELDTLVDVTLSQEGVLGARMTGAGFGGCAIALVANDHVEQIMNNVIVNYHEKIGYKPTFYQVTISDGAKQIEL